MKNLKFELEKTFRSIKASNEADKLKKERQLIPVELYNPNATAIYLTASFKDKIIKVNTGLKIKPIKFDPKKKFKEETFDPKNDEIHLALNSIMTKCLLKQVECQYKSIEFDESIIEVILSKSVTEVMDSPSNKTK